MEHLLTKKYQFMEEWSLSWRFWKQIHHRDYERTAAADTLMQDELRKIFLQLGEEMPNLVKKQRRTYRRLKTHDTWKYGAIIQKC